MSLSDPGENNQPFNPPTDRLNHPLIRVEIQLPHAHTTIAIPFGAIGSLLRQPAQCARRQQVLTDDRAHLPHLLRLVLGPDHRLLVPAAALGGGAFLVVCDTIARSLLAGRELPVGAITAMAGGPLFLWLLRRHHLRTISA